MQNSEWIEMGEMQVPSASKAAQQSTTSIFSNFKYFFIPVCSFRIGEFCKQIILHEHCFFSFHNKWFQNIVFVRFIVNGSCVA
jgi:hypothetical protein